MHNESRNFPFIGGPLRSALAFSLIFVPIGYAMQTAAQEAVQGTELAAAAAKPVVPQQVRYAGKMATRAGDTVEAVFHIYASEQGGEPLWTETQKVTVAEDGSYSVLLGGATSSGLPQTVFAGGAARWLGVSVERSPEQERVLLSSVPYAMKSADAESLSGHAASDFVTQGQLAQLTQLAQSSSQQGVAGPEVQPLTSGAVTGSGTAGTVPLWTGTLTQGNSIITQVGTDIGINEATPGATLDVNGTATFRGTATLPALGTATTSAGFRSQLLDFTDSAWSTTTKAPVAQTWRLYVTDAGNDTANPTSTFNVQFQNGAGAATPTVLSIAQTGVIAFAPTQTFPGTIASVAATSPVTATTTSGAVSLGLNTTALETTLNAKYPQLVTGNTFTSYLKASNAAGPGNDAVLGTGTNGSVGVAGSSDTGYGLQGKSTSGFGVYAQVTTPAAGDAGVFGFTGAAHSATYTSENSTANAGIWADTSASGTGNPQAGAPIGLFATADDAYGLVAITNGGDFPALFANNNTGTAGEFTAATGYGVDASTTSGTGVFGSTDGGGNGVLGINLGATEGEAGVLGEANTASVLGSSFDIYSGVWGDTGTSSTAISPAWAIGVLGTADDGHAGVFLNNSADWSTVYIQNEASGGATGLFKTFMAKSVDGTCGIGSGGSLSCTGQIKSLVSAGNGQRTVETYAVQSPENWMEDFGSGQLQKGVAVVTIDAAFSETVTGDANYHVFLTPRGDSKGLYVINTTPTTFEVRESGGGTSSLAFDYRIVAKRRGFEAQRLVDVTEHFRAEQKAASMMRSSGIRHKPAPLAKSPLLAKMNAKPRIEVPMPHPAPESRPATMTTHP
jgi:hypothetical protein